MISYDLELTLITLGTFYMILFLILSFSISRYLIELTYFNEYKSGIENNYSINKKEKE